MHLINELLEGELWGLLFWRVCWGLLFDG